MDSPARSLHCGDRTRRQVRVVPRRHVRNVPAFSPLSEKTTVIRQRTRNCTTWWISQDPRKSFRTLILTSGTPNKPRLWAWAHIPGPGRRPGRCRRGWFAGVAGAVTVGAAGVITAGVVAARAAGVVIGAGVARAGYIAAGHIAAGTASRRDDSWAEDAGEETAGRGRTGAGAEGRRTARAGSSGGASDRFRSPGFCRCDGFRLPRWGGSPGAAEIGCRGVAQMAQPATTDPRAGRDRKRDG